MNDKLVRSTEITKNSISTPCSPDKLMENRAQLDELDGRSDDLRNKVVSGEQSYEFETSSTKLKRKYQWEKYRIVLAVGALGLVAVAQQALLFVFSKLL
jgi:Synaptobrevin